MPSEKWIQATRGGMPTGREMLVFLTSKKKYVSIPGVTKFRNAK